jgi:uncharacterized protein
MTPQERQLIAELFERLAKLEGKPRDPEAERAISEGLRDAPHALYPLVQTVLVQDDALRQADARIRELEGELPREGGFLDQMRDSLLGRRDGPRGSVPSVRPDGPGFRNAPGYRSMEQQPPQYQQPPYQPPPPQGGGFGGGSFLGTAAASAAGMIGGALLLNSFRHMLPGGEGQKHSAFDQNAGTDSSPWGGDASGGDLARQAGVDDIGRGDRLSSADQFQDQRTGLFDVAQGGDADDGHADDGGGFDGGGDTA